MNEKEYNENKDNWFMDMKSLYPTITLTEWQKGMFDLYMNPNLKLNFSRGHTKSTIATLATLTYGKWLHIMFELGDIVKRNNPVELQQVPQHDLFSYKCITAYRELCKETKSCIDQFILTSFIQDLPKTTKFINECWEDSGECIEIGLLLFKTGLKQEAKDNAKPIVYANAPAFIVMDEPVDPPLVLIDEQHKLNKSTGFIPMYIDPGIEKAANKFIYKRLKKRKKRFGFFRRKRKE